MTNVIRIFCVIRTECDVQFNGLESLLYDTQKRTNSPLKQGEAIFQRFIAERHRKILKEKSKRWEINNDFAQYPRSCEIAEMV